MYTTPFTNTAFGSVLSQVQMNLLDNSGLPGPVYFRIAIYLFQIAEKKSTGYNEATRLGQTDEITLYPSKDQILYANLMSPVSLLSEGDYGIGIYSNLPFFIAGGPERSGFSAEPQFWSETEGQSRHPYHSTGHRTATALLPLTVALCVWWCAAVSGYNDYSAPQAILMYPGDRSHPVAAAGCYDPNAYNRPGQTAYAFCGLIETYLPLPPPPPGWNPRTYFPSASALTNVTRYSGVILVNNTEAALVQTDYGAGQPITFMAGEVQTTTNAGAEYYPPLGLTSAQLSYKASHPVFAQALDLLYPNRTIPIDVNGVVISTARNQTRLFWTNVSANSTIGQQGQDQVVLNTYFSSFLIFPAQDLDTVITSCNIPLGYDYVQDVLTCPAGSAQISFGDIDQDDLDPLEEDEIYDYLRPNLISFRRFTVWTPATTAYQLSYYSYSNPEAIVHMRLGLFVTNQSYVDSTSAEPIFILLAMTNEVELVNADDTIVVANLSTPIALTQGQTYAIGVWADSLVYVSAFHSLPLYPFTSSLLLPSSSAHCRPRLNCRPVAVCVCRGLRRGGEWMRRG